MLFWLKSKCFDIYWFGHPPPSKKPQSISVMSNHPISPFLEWHILLFRFGTKFFLHEKRFPMVKIGTKCFNRHKPKMFLKFCFAGNFKVRWKKFRITEFPAKEQMHSPSPPLPPAYSQRLSPEFLCLGLLSQHTSQWLPSLIHLLFSILHCSWLQDWGSHGPFCLVLAWMNGKEVRPSTARHLT